MQKCDLCGSIQPCVCCDRKTGKCLDCGKPILPRSSRCRSCQGKRIHQPVQAPKITWPDLDRLQEMVFVCGYAEVARRLRVSDNAVRKHLRKELFSSQYPASTTLRQPEPSGTGSEQTLPGSAPRPLEERRN